MPIDNLGAAGAMQKTESTSIISKTWDGLAQTVSPDAGVVGVTISEARYAMSAVAIGAALLGGWFTRSRIEKEVDGEVMPEPYLGFAF